MIPPTYFPFVRRPASVSFGSFCPWYLGATVLDGHVRRTACPKRPPRVALFPGRGEEGLRLGNYATCLRDASFLVQEKNR